MRFNPKALILTIASEAFGWGLGVSLLMNKADAGAGPLLFLISGKVEYGRVWVQ